MTTEWRPAWVEKIDREITGYEHERDQHRSMADEYDRKIGELQDKRRTWTEQVASGGG